MNLKYCFFSIFIAIAVPVFFNSYIFAAAPALPQANFTSNVQMLPENKGTAEITITLTSTPAADVTISYIVSGTAAGQGIDHDLADGQILIEAGKVSGSVSFNIIDDDLDESDEFIIVEMDILTNAAKGSISVQTITIQDNDTSITPSVSWISSIQQKAESAGSVSVAVMMSRTADYDVTIPYTVSGTAQTGADHDLVDGSILIPAGKDTGIAVFNIIDDSEIEDNETIILTMGEIVNADRGSVTVFTLTILDNDRAAEIPSVSWASAVQQVRENAGIVTITAVLSTLSANDVILPFTITGTASGDGTDHDLTDGEMTIPAASSMGTIVINLTDDALEEGDETIIITMGSPENAVPGAITVQTITIQDNDIIGDPSVSWASSLEQVSEDSETVTITAVLSTSSIKDITIPYTVSGTAAGGEVDHNLADGIITIPAGNVTGTAVFNITDDTTPESNETIIVTMGEPENVKKGSITIFTVTIIDNDIALKPSVSWASAVQQVTEGAGTASITAVLNMAAVDDVLIPYTITGRAEGGGVDHDLSDGEIIIPSGGNNNNIVFNITDDTLHEEDETIIVIMGTPVNADKGSISIHTITIQDNDTAPTPYVSWNAPLQQVPENAEQVKLTAVLSMAAESDVTVPFTIKGSAEPGGVDHDLADGEITIPAGESTGTLLFNLVDDTFYEEDETIIVIMGTPSGADKGSITIHTITILDNETVFVSFTSASQQVREDAGVIEIGIVMTTASGEDVTIPYTLSGTAEGGGTDYELEDGEIIIKAGKTSAKLIFNLIDDEIFEQDETAILTMGTPVNAGHGSITVHTITITEDQGLVSASDGGGGCFIKSLKH
ncbi:Calx-beta domain-containing protein [Desulfonema limicola]|uniref:Calx-beta domain-containing protein n=1 Tax=Desulfonema limicola TaxID=45656 RepID=A0A975B9G5_9BACT|nr:Calx-beta domain-containing protein [Desulfonema limicola]QTA81203.1 Calx-beta domain-containing protein [Desulfonema limicola]